MGSHLRQSNIHGVVQAILRDGHLGTVDHGAMKGDEPRPLVLWHDEHRKPALSVYVRASRTLGCSCLATRPVPRSGFSSSHEFFLSPTSSSICFMNGTSRSWLSLSARAGKDWRS